MAAELSTLAAVSFCAFAGAIVSALVGFGGAVVFLAFATLAAKVLGLSIEFVIMLGIVRSVVNNPYILYLGGCEHFAAREFAVMLPGLLIGAPVGQYALSIAPAATIQSFVGFICLLVAAERIVSIAQARRLEADAAEAAVVGPSRPSKTTSARAMARRAGRRYRRGETPGVDKPLILLSRFPICL